jgi:hypothetical protein
MNGISAFYKFHALFQQPRVECAISPLAAIFGGGSILRNVADTCSTFCCLLSCAEISDLLFYKSSRLSRLYVHNEGS